MTVSSYINHFVQPDTIIPDPSNPQAWNRYAYVGNNPVLLNDPSGHCPTCLIGAAVGAIAGAVFYAGTTWSSGREWNNSDYLASVAVGAFGGLLIGTGIGALEGVAAFAAIGAGTGAIGGQAGYSVASGKDYDSGEMLISAGAGAVSGAITGAVSGGAGLAAAGAPARIIAQVTTKVVVTNAAVNGIASVAQYELTARYNRSDVNNSGRAVSFISGATSSLVMDGITGSTITTPAVNRMIAANNPYFNMMINGRASGLTQLLIKEAGSQAIRSATADFTSRKLDRLMEK